MRSPLPSWVLLVYLAIDLANPFVPGAFEFTPKKGAVWVEAASHARPELSVGTSEASPPGPAPGSLLTEGEHSRSTEHLRLPDLRAWLVGVRTGDPPARDLPPPSPEDH